MSVYCEYGLHATDPTPLLLPLSDELLVPPSVDPHAAPVLQSPAPFKHVRPAALSCAHSMSHCDAETCEQTVPKCVHAESHVGALSVVDEEDEEEEDEEHAKVASTNEPRAIPSHRVFMADERVMTIRRL